MGSEIRPLLHTNVNKPVLEARLKPQVSAPIGYKAPPADSIVEMITSVDKCLCSLSKQTSVCQCSNCQPGEST